MPNIFKSFLKPAFAAYTFPEAEDLQVEEEPAPQEESPPEPEEAPAGEEASESAGQEAGQNSVAAMLSFAQVQADEILADARRERDRLLEEAREQVKQEAEAVREEARADGFRQGCAEGLTQARAEWNAKQEEALRHQAEEFRVFLEKASAARESLMDETQVELCDLSLAIAEKIIHVSLKSSREVVARMIQTATEKLKRREWVHIYVGGCEARDLAQVTPELTTALAGLSDHIKIIPMSDGEAGACIIEMPNEIIDASASTQLGNIRDLLREG